MKVYDSQVATLVNIAIILTTQLSHKGQLPSDAKRTRIHRVHVHWYGKIRSNWWLSAQ